MALGLFLEEVKQPDCSPPVTSFDVTCAQDVSGACVCKCRDGLAPIDGTEGLELECYNPCETEDPTNRNCKVVDRECECGCIDGKRRRRLH